MTYRWYKWHGDWRHASGALAYRTIDENGVVSWWAMRPEDPDGMARGPFPDAVAAKAAADVQLELFEGETP
jgi:hypothetical protein